MTVSVNFSLLLAIASIIGTAATAFTFFNKLKWDSIHQQAEINKIKDDIIKLQERQMNELKPVMVKVDSIDKSVIEIYATLKYVQDTVKKIEAGLNR